MLGISWITSLHISALMQHFFLRKLQHMKGLATSAVDARDGRLPARLLSEERRVSAHRRHGSAFPRLRDCAHTDPLLDLSILACALEMGATVSRCEEEPHREVQGEGGPFMSGEYVSSKVHDFYLLPSLLLQLWSNQHTALSYTACRELLCIDCALMLHTFDACTLENVCHSLAKRSFRGPFAPAQSWKVHLLIGFHTG